VIEHLENQWNGDLQVKPLHAYFCRELEAVLRSQRSRKAPAIAAG